MSEKLFINDIVVSSRIRLARNISQIPFPSRANDEESQLAMNRALDALTDNASLEADAFRFTNLDSLSALSRQSMVEKHLISPELGKYRQSGTVINSTQTVSVMVNEEDHIRIQCILPGFSLEKAYTEANRIDDAIQEKLPFAFSEKYGFLTTCPSNLGTGMRAGVMLHIPAVVLNSRLSGIANMAGRFGLAIRGIYGEGSEALGDFFQISNQYSLGLTEEEIVSNIHSIAKEIIKLERDERNKLLINQEDILKDKIQRAFGVLTNAYMLSTKEAMSLLSLLRMGADLQIFQGVGFDTLNQLITEIQPATLALSEDERMDERMRDICRARIIKEKLTEKGN